MSSIDYLLPVVSILIGLAVADLAVSLHRLLRARHRVRWDWLPMLAAAMALLSVLSFWWQFPLLGRVELWATYAAFLLVMATLVVLVLLSAAALPDEVPQEGLDLRAYYLENRRYFWSLYTLFLLLVILIQVTPFVVRGVPPGVSLGRLAAGMSANVLLTGAYLSLALVRSRRYHAVLVPLLLLGMAWNWAYTPAGEAPSSRQAADRGSAQAPARP